jgi:hypothetical protein
MKGMRKNVRKVRGSFGNKVAAERGKGFDE